MDAPTAQRSAWMDSLDVAIGGVLGPLLHGGGRLGVLYSGGVDSSLLAWELRHRPETILFTLGASGSPDLTYGRRGAELVGLPWFPLNVDREDAIATERRFDELFRTLTTVGRSVLLALALAIERADAPRLVCGQGADELFMGYAHFRGLDAPAADLRVRNDLDRLRRVDWPVTVSVAERCGKRVLAPFLDPSFERAALDTPVEDRMPRNSPKAFFREWAERRGLPHELAHRPKKALQYGSGVEALRREGARGQV